MTDKTFYILLSLIVLIALVAMPAAYRLHHYYGTGAVTMALAMSLMELLRRRLRSLGEQAEGAAL